MATVRVWGKKSARVSTSSQHDATTGRRRQKAALDRISGCMGGKAGNALTGRQRIAKDSVDVCGCVGLHLGRSACLRALTVLFVWILGGRWQRSWVDDACPALSVCETEGGFCGSRQAAGTCKLGRQARKGQTQGSGDVCVGWFETRKRAPTCLVRSNCWKTRRAGLQGGCED